MSLSFSGSLFFCLFYFYFDMTVTCINKCNYKGRKGKNSYWPMFYFLKLHFLSGYIFQLKKTKQNTDRSTTNEGSEITF